MKWTDGPPSNAGLPHLPLFRVRTGEIVRGVITCLEIAGCDTHFMANRTQPCSGDETCPGCKAELARRWEGYISVWTVAQKHHLYALTPRAANSLLNSVADGKNLRGLFVTIERKGRRPNSPLDCRAEQPDVISVKLPPIPDVHRHLLRIWGLEEAHIGQDNPGYSNSVKSQAQNGRMNNGA